MYADINERLQEHLSEAMVNNNISDWFVIASNGSMNYGLETPDSDIDSKLLTIPSLKQLINDKRSNYLHEMSDNGEHVEVKDVAIYMKTILKQNINFVETLFAKGVFVNPKYQDEWDVLIENRERIARYDTRRAAKCMCGMMIKKQKDMVTPTPGRQESINRIGYDAKSFHHIVRLYCFLQKYYIGLLYEHCLMKHSPLEYKMLMDSKNGLYAYDDAVREADIMINKAQAITDELVSEEVSDWELSNREYVKNLIDDIVYSVIEKSLCKSRVGQLN